MHFEINKGWIRRARLWLARQIAPAGSDVHDPDETDCPWMQAVLEEACWSGYRIDEQLRFWMNVTDAVQEAHDRDLVAYGEHGSVYLTEAGELDLARRWGPERVPPWSGGYYDCDLHGEYQLDPGERIGCRPCVHQEYVIREALDALPRWHWKRVINAPR